MFSKQVITGPLLVFFILLALSVLAGTGDISKDILNKTSTTDQIGVINDTTITTGLITNQADFLINYIIAIAMLFVGLMLTSQMGGAAGKIAGAASNWMQRSGTGFVT